MEESRFIQLSLTLLMCLVPLVTADDTVKFKFYGQTITSSTLKWIAVSDGTVPENAVVGSLEYFLPEGVTEQDLLQNISAKAAIRERKIYICRARVNSKFIPGGLIEKSPGKFVCVVFLITHVHQRDKYDVLQNVDKAARLIWENWEKSKEVPNGAVLSGENYVAHSRSPNFKVLQNDIGLGMVFLMGQIEPNVGIFGKMSVVTEDLKVSPDVSGQVLVEKEPVMYELTVDNLIKNRMRVNWRNDTTVLGETTLRNDDPNEMKAEAVITYSWKYISSWGFGRAMLKGLPTTIYTKNSSSVENITWGVPFEEDRSGIEKVEYMLPAGTASHVKVVGDYMELEVPYKGRLISVFNDSTMMNRTVEWTWRYRTIDVKIIYGPLYYVQNMSMVPTTTTTTTQPPPTTTPSTTTMTNEIPKTTINQNGKNDDKKTTSSVKEDMQNDQNNALQLNKGDESGRTGSGSRCFSHSSFIINSLLISLVFGYISNTIT